MKLVLVLPFLFVSGCMFRPTYARWEPERIEPKTKEVCAAKDVCYPKTQSEFDIWIRDQQRRGVL